MAALFLVCALVGAGLLVLQLVGAGLDHGELHAGDHGAGGGAHDAFSHGLHLFGVRSLTAALAFFGTAGWLALRAGWSPLLALPAAVLAGLVAMVGVAMMLRSMTRLESDGTLRYANALGLDGRVHVSIPGARDGAGKVMLTLQGRLVELPAVTTGAAIPTGTAVTVVDVQDDDVLEVRPADEVTLLPEV